jgi:hypothetical protein
MFDNIIIVKKFMVDAETNFWGTDDPQKFGQPYKKMQINLPLKCGY